MLKGIYIPKRRTMCEKQRLHIQSGMTEKDMLKLGFDLLPTEGGYA